MLTKSNLNNIEVLISKASIHSVFSHDEFALINNVLKEYTKMQEERKIERLNQFIKDFILFIKQCYCIIL